MSDAMVLSSPFVGNFVEAKENTKQRLREEFHSTKLRVIKETLKGLEVPYDANALTLDALKTDLKNNLSDTEFKMVSNTIEEISKEFEDMFYKLQNGSVDALTQFVNKVQKFANPIYKATTHSLASRTALILAPTLGSKLAVGGALALRSAFKLSKNRKSGIVVDQMYQCNKMLQEMEISKNGNGEIIDTRFNENMQAVIRQFLTDKKIDFIDTGYLSLREAIYSLELENKKELCHLLNNQFGKGIDVKERLDKVSMSFFDSLKEKGKKVLAAGASGVGVATAVNSIDPAIMASPVNGVLAGMGANKFLGNSILSSIVGLGTGAATAITEHLPVVGETFENVYAAENLCVAGIAGLGAGVVGAAAMSAVNLVRGLADKFNTRREKKEIMKMDSEKYLNENKEEFKRIHQSLETKENSFVEQAGIDLIYNRMIDLGIKVNVKPKNTLELTRLLNGLSDDDKKKMTKYIGNLRDYNDNDYGDVFNAVIKAGKVLSSLTLLGLSGLSVYDIVKDGEFLPQLSAELFKDVPNNIYLMIPEKTMIEGMDYKGEYVNSESTVSMIAEKDLGATEAHYNELLNFTKEETKVYEIKQNIVNDGEVFVEDVKSAFGDFISDPKATINNAFTSAKDSFFGFIDKCGKAITNPGETLSNLWNGTKENVSDAINTVKDIVTEEVITVPDEAAIEAYLDGLTIEEQVNLAYYFNNSTAVDSSSLNYQSIALALQKRLPAIQDAIEKYNQKMDMIFGVDKAVTVSNEILPFVTEFDEEVRKVA